MEKIILINEISEGGGWSSKSGFAISTDKQVIKLLIDNHQDCCEHWGYFMSEDNLNSFIGASIKSISLTDTALNTKRIDEELPYGVENGGCMFVNIDTDRGCLQFTAYNSHNGYYGHEATVISEQLNYEKYL